MERTHPWQREPGGSARVHHRPWVRWAGALGMPAAVLMLTVVSARGQNPGPDVDKSIHDPTLTTPPDANAQMLMRERQLKQQDYEAANAERRKHIVEESDQLLTLAMALKAEVDKTDKGKPSPSLIRKADEIEKLAHNVKERMKVAVGGS